MRLFFGLPGLLGGSFGGGFFGAARFGFLNSFVGIWGINGTVEDRLNSFSFNTFLC